MKLKRTNWYYMAGLLPGTMLNICLGMYLARNILWLKTVILLSGAVVCAGIVKKFCAVPHSEKSYGQMKPFGMKLPVSYEVDLYLCAEISRYEFILCPYVYFFGDVTIRISKQNGRGNLSCENERTANQDCGQPRNFGKIW